MKVAITGATGFLGSSLAHYLIKRGAEIHALVRPTSDRSRLAGMPVVWYEGDVTELKTLPAFLQNADWVIHAAGLLGKAGVSKEEYQQVNILGTENVLTAVANQPTPPHVLHISSVGVLGPARKGLSTDTFDEKAPLAPSNLYEWSKAEGEKVALRFAKQGVPVRVLRPEFVYGPGDLHVLGLFRAVQKGIFFYVGNGKNTCHPTYIGDLNAGIHLIMTRGKNGEIYHITGEKPLSFNEFATTIATELGVRPPFIRVPQSFAMLGAMGLEGLNKIAGTPVPLSRTGVDFFSEWRGSTYAKAQRELGYTPQVNLQEGVTKTVAWYRENELL
jgi:nucleoside-diphosphate-sugar epimerase